MYITYERTQRLIRDARGFADPGSSLSRPFLPFDVPKFKPTWLVRISDMKRVPGSTVTGYYWALSYSWNQSGEVIYKGDGRYERTDQSKHQIIQPQIIVEHTQFGKQKKFDYTKMEIRYSSFKRLIRTICRDFGIRYIWYDQMCIDQDDPDAKLQEIRQMHLIYKNAYFTLALIPELELTGDKDSSGRDITNIDVIPNSQWSKRMWTLEEAYMSREVLFVGRNVHFWSDYIEATDDGKTGTFIRNMQDRKDYEWKACTVLWYAKARTSSKAHDEVFALVNIFPELKEGITFSYRQPILDLTIQFYNLLAQKDISILAFGTPIDSNVDDEWCKIRQKEAMALPSWTGANGTHVPQSCFQDQVVKTSFHWTTTGKYMSLTSGFIVAHMEPAASVSPRKFNKNDNHLYTTDGLLPRLLIDRKGPITTAHKAKELKFVSTTLKSQKGLNMYINTFGLKVTHLLPVKEEGSKFSVNTLAGPTHIGALLSLTEDASECVVATGIKFTTSSSSPYSFCCHPVFKKGDYYYKSVGLCFIFDYVDWGHMVEPKNTFIIQ
ncbi:hypothetical protein BJV82DRAFT_599202 [Fennellomyces sp. T-0311]|nr:hypothetical protein BJV82DRAFT_599202 [Fennellomyces sp. T-0311]